MSFDKITAFTSENCIHCRQLKKWLAKHSLDFENKDIQVVENHEQLRAMGHNFIPIILLSNSSEPKDSLEIRGFDKQKLKQVLNIIED